MCISITIKYVVIILDYDLICKNNLKWGLVSLALGPDGHLRWVRGHFPVILYEHEKWHARVKLSHEM